MAFCGVSSPFGGGLVPLSGYKGHGPAEYFTVPDLKTAAGNSLKLGFIGGAAQWLTPFILKRFQESYPQVDLRLRETTFMDPSGGLGSGDADVAFIRPPIETPGLWFEVLIERPRFFAVGVRHALADRAEVSVAEILDEPIIAINGTDRTWERFWALDDFRDGRPARGEARQDGPAERC